MGHMKQQHVYQVIVETQTGNSSVHVFEYKDDALKFKEYASKQPEVTNVYQQGILPTDLESNAEKLAVWLEDYIN